MLPTTGRAYALLWRHRLLHIKAIGVPVVFLVAAEFLYHRIMGDARSLADHWQALLAAPWYETGGAVLCWLAGLKFLLSFSISWRRRLLLGERFDPLFFGKPFWKYLAYLVWTYVWSIAVLMVALLAGAAAAGAHLRWLGAVPVALALLLIAWGIVRRVPFFTVLTLDSPQPGLRDAVAAMRGNVLRYAAAWLLAMLPVAALNAGLDQVVQWSGADPRAVPVALGESVFRQAMLFLHFSLGASVGALTTVAVLLRGAGVREPA